MSFKLLDRAVMSVSGTPGTGTITLGSAATGFQSFASAGLGNADTTAYVLTDGSAWEIGVGTYNTTGPTFARTTITASSNSGSAITASSAAVVTATMRAEDVNLVDLLSMSKPAGTSDYAKGEYIPIANGATVTLFDYMGVGYMSALSIAVAGGSGTVADTATINFYFDGASTPNISMPLSTFFNAKYMGTNGRYFSNRFFGANSASGAAFGAYCKLPMPFGTEIKCTIYNGSGNGGTIWFQANFNIGVPNTWPSTRRLYADYQAITSPTKNATVTLVNKAGVSGRLVGVFMLADEYPGSEQNYNAELEGNFRFWLDKVATTWVASTSYSLGATIIDSQGNEQTVTTAGTSGSSAPSWAVAGAATTTDGSVTWTCAPGDPPNALTGLIAGGSQTPFVGFVFTDPNGNAQRCTYSGAVSVSNIAGTTWATGTGSSTTCGGATFVCDGPPLKSSFQTSGTEDYFLMGFYGYGALSGGASGNGETGTAMNSTSSGSSLGSNTTTISFYRYHVSDPMVFKNSLVATWQAGDTSEKDWGTGNPELWFVTYYYTE